MTETEIWTKWESQVVNGIFPLRRFLGRSNHSVVFLTECRARNLANAAIKIVPADPARAEWQLSRWQSAAALSHPHLIRILEAGRCKLGGHPFLFVVTEYAEQNLAQILPHRALSPEEVREMLVPTLDALGYLHHQNLVHGQLKASNFLVVNDQLKLASDTIRPAGDTAANDSAGDVRALGATIVEALTQVRPALNAAADLLSLPPTLSLGLADAVLRTLSPDPASRPTVADLQNQIHPAAGAPTLPAAPESSLPAPSARPVSPPPPQAAHAPAPPAGPRWPASLPPARWIVPAAAASLVLLAVWGGNRLLRGPGDSRPKAVPSASQPAISPATAQSPAASQSAGSPVLHEEIPVVSRGARESIHGQIKVAVRVTTDRSGNVVAQNLEIHGSSRYFARLALEAAKKWKFAPADSQSPHEWLVQFEFSRDGVTGHALPRGRQ